MRSLRGALAAAVTPLRDGGEQLDDAAFEPLVRFLVEGGLDGILAMGTTGEGVMLSAEERTRAAELFVRARPAGFTVAVHCGAQSTRDTERLAAHAAETGADAVAVIAPPYFEFDAIGLLRHFRQAAAACAPLPFYVYEFAARSGYSVPVSVVERLREATPNLRGLKVSDTPLEAVLPYIIDGLDIFVGSEPLALEAFDRGAVGAVSGLATAFPELVAGLVHDRSAEALAQVTLLRERLSEVPFQAAMKVVVAARGVPVRPHVRAPLRELNNEERAVALAVAHDVLEGLRTESPR